MKHNFTKTLQMGYCRLVWERVVAHVGSHGISCVDMRGCCGRLRVASAGYTPPHFGGVWSAVSLHIHNGGFLMSTF